MAVCSREPLRDTLKTPYPVSSEKKILFNTLTFFVSGKFWTPAFFSAIPHLVKLYTINAKKQRKNRFDIYFYCNFWYAWHYEKKMYRTAFFFHWFRNSSR
jgi:hypothetical protein